MTVQFRNEKLVIMALYRSPLTVTLWPSSFLTKYGPMIHQPIKRTSQFFWIKRCFDIHLWISFTPNAAVLFVYVAIQPEVRFIAKQNCWKKSSKIGRPDWTTSEPAVAVICQKSYLKCNARRLSFE
ncbi:hypothetical protein TNCV_1182461 [Trichonephila clavipes]|nr:hypothetical protein TNCV_1182461 [Trichonephila clavipes]